MQEDEMGGACSAHGSSNECVNFIKKLEGKRRLRGPEGKFEDNINVDRRKYGGKWGDWIHVAQDMAEWRDPVNTAMSFWAL
jgi:hypothetical protein